MRSRARQSRSGVPGVYLGEDVVAAARRLDDSLTSRSALLDALVRSPAALRVLKLANVLVISIAATLLYHLIRRISDRVAATSDYATVPA